MVPLKMVAISLLPRLNKANLTLPLNQHTVHGVIIAYSNTLTNFTRPSLLSVA